MNRLILIRGQLEEALRGLLVRPDHLAIWPLGSHAGPDGVDLLGCEPRFVSSARAAGFAGGSGRAAPTAGQLELALSHEPGASQEAWEAQARAAGGWQARLVIGTGPARGRLAAALLSPQGEPCPLDALALAGPGMHRFRLTPSAEEQVGSQGAFGPFPPALRAAARWSRTRGALGAEAWRRLTGLRYGVVGCGRTGSLLAQALAAMGVRHLALVDPDRLERHNLGEMVMADEADLGWPKAEALARRLTTACPWTSAEAVAASVTARRALDALAGCDVLCCCADRDSARLATGILAALYLKPLLDLGTGVLHPGAGDAPSMGADVRLILPGEGCLLDYGGVAEMGEAQQSLRSAWAEAASRAGRGWQRERAGSLLSLNQIAVGLALRLWEDLVAERRRAGTWLRLEFDRQGQPVLRALPPGQEPGPCPLCRHRGAGDAGLPLAVSALLAEPAEATSHPNSYGAISE